jgi:HAE1 family hydrophobic/amphiphilic exporter-1
VIAWAARRPAVVWAAAAGIVIAGGVASTRLPLATRPVVELPRLSVAASWPGASAELVEANVTAPIEAAVQGVRGVRSVDSESREGSAAVTVHLGENEDVRMVRLAINERLELLRGDFPPGASPPALSNYVPQDLAEAPLLRYTVSGPYTPGTLARLLQERVQPAIAAVPGVGAVQLPGGVATVGIGVSYDRAALARSGVRPEALEQALLDSRMVRALGSQSDGALRRYVLVRDEPDDAAELARLPVRGPGGRVYRLGELAAIRTEEDSRDRFYRLDGQPAVALQVTREARADAIRTARAVRRAVEQVAPALAPGVRVRLDRDESEALRGRLVGLLKRGAVAVSAVILVLAAALRSARAVALVLAGVVIAVAGTALGLYLLGVPANLLTLAGLAMGTGILVQNGVVVVDRLRGARDAPEARAAAAARITPAVLGATLTTAVVLVPFLYLQGNSRAAFMPFAVAFLLALGWSVLASLVALPAMAGGGLKLGGRWRPGRRLYTRCAIVLVRGRWIALPIGAALLVLAGWGFATRVQRSSWAWWGAQREQLTASMRFPRGSDPASLDAGMRELEQIVVGHRGVDRVVVTGSRDAATLVVTFVDDPGMVPFQLEEELIRRGLYIGGASISVRYTGQGFYSGGFGGGSSTHRIKLLGYSFGELERIALDLKERLERIPRVSSVNINAGGYFDQERGFEIALLPDRAALARFGLTARDLAAALGRELSGAVGSRRMMIGGGETEVSLKDAGARSRTLDQLRQAIVPAPSGAPVRVGEVALVEERENLTSISRQDQQYVRIVGYDFRGPPRLAQRTHEAFMRSITLPPGYSASDQYFGWQRDESARLLWLVFAVGVVLVVLGVAMVFDSAWATAMVFLSLPVALAGSVAAFWIAGAVFSREAAVGAVLVVGLAVNQAILVVDAALERRRSGGAEHRRRALGGADVVRAARDRVGMVVLVTLTSLASLIPMAVGTKPDELFGAVALATTGGIVAGTIGALVFLPALLPVMRWRSGRPSGGF